MEAVEVLVASPQAGRYKDLSPIAKGKRTKRHRPHSPNPFPITTTTHNKDDDHHLLLQGPTTISSSEEESTTTEEIDTAKCLILLSRGYFLKTPHDPPNNNNHPCRNNATTKVGAGNACVYTCKTCNRSFPSFQALGGHRASHKKPKNERKSASIFSDEEDFPSPSMSSSKNRFSLNSLSLQLSNASTTTFSTTLLKSLPSPRIHECSYCSAEFTSGQALGGHMRKHRSGPIIRSADIVPRDASVEEIEPEESKNPLNVGFSLDLNLPAPEDEKEKSSQETKPRLRPCCFSHHYYSTID
ncbi:hypothetical protein OROMI_001299 [Orobanche minor]